MRLAVAFAVLAAALSGCLNDNEPDDGGFTDFIKSPDCPDDDFVVWDDITVGNMAGNGRTDEGQYEVFSLDVAELTGWTAREAACVEAIQVDLEWTNDPSAGGDLWVGVVVPGTGVEVQGHDQQQFVADGEHHESVLAATQAYEDFTGEAMLAPLEVRIHTDWATLSQSGLEATITITLIV